MIADYPRAVKYLKSFINYEDFRGFSYKGSFKLERAARLFRKLGIKPAELPAVHIAGTKGKGSTAVFLSSVLAASGLKVGLYTSPHLEDFRERIRIVQGSGSRVQGSLISRKDVVDLLRVQLSVIQGPHHRVFGATPSRFRHGDVKRI